MPAEPVLVVANWELRARRAAWRSWCFLFFKGSVGGVCTCFLAAVAQQRAQAWEFLFIRAPLPGHRAAQARGRTLPWSREDPGHKRGCKALDPVGVMARERARGEPWGCAASAHCSGLGSANLWCTGPMALNEPSPPGSRLRLCESSLCFVISVLLSARVSVQSSRWQKSMFSHWKKCLQTSVFFLRAVNNATCGILHGAVRDGSVTTHLICILAEPRLPSQPRAVCRGGELAAGRCPGSWG